MKTKIKVCEVPCYPIKVVIKLESREDVLKFIAANSYASYPDDPVATYEGLLQKHVAKDAALATLEKILSNDQWQELYDLAANTKEEV